MMFGLLMTGGYKSKSGSLSHACNIILVQHGARPAFLYDGNDIDENNFYVIAVRNHPELFSNVRVTFVKQERGKVVRQNGYFYNLNLVSEEEIQATAELLGEERRIAMGKILGYRSPGLVGNDRFACFAIDAAAVADKTTVASEADESRPDEAGSSESSGSESSESVSKESVSEKSVGKEAASKEVARVKLYTYGYKFDTTEGGGDRDRQLLVEEREQLQQVLEPLGIRVVSYAKCKCVVAGYTRLFRNRATIKGIGMIIPKLETIQLLEVSGHVAPITKFAKTQHRETSERMATVSSKIIFRHLGKLVELTRHHGFIATSTALSEVTNEDELNAALEKISDRVMYYIFKHIQEGVELADPYVEGIVIPDFQICSNRHCEKAWLNIKED